MLYANILASRTLPGDDEAFKETIFTIVKSAFVGALSDEEFISEASQSAVAAMVTASQDDVIRQSVLGVVTQVSPGNVCFHSGMIYTNILSFRTLQGVSEALHDEDFIAEIRGVVKGSLSDGELYRSGAKGVLNAAFGSRNKKDGSERSTSSGSSGKKTGSKHELTAKEQH
jgi:hypothetical protein